MIEPTDKARLDWLSENLDTFFNSKYHIIAKFDGLRAALDLAMKPDVDEGGDPGVHDKESEAAQEHYDNIARTDADEAQRR